jgi:hypothetical protein
MNIRLTNEQIDYIVTEDLFFQYQEAIEDDNEHLAECIMEVLKYYGGIRDE